MWAQTDGNTFYVSASGNDGNDGLTEATAFKTPNYAIMRASISDNIKIITIIGTLNERSEGGSDENNVFTIMGMLDTPILITGIPDAPDGRRAVLSATGTRKNCVNIAMGSFRFEHIEISGSSGIGLVIQPESDVTLGPGAMVKNNQGFSGVVVLASGDRSDISWPGFLTLDGGIIENNQGSIGGIFIAGGAFTMKRGSVRNNTAISTEEGPSGGGGIYIASNELISIEGGDISGNTADVGGGINIIKSGSVTISGGSISGNTAKSGGGGINIDSSDLFIKGGDISGNTAVIGGGIGIGPQSSVTMSGGSISGNSATTGAGGVMVYEGDGAIFIQQGGMVSGNRAPDYADIYRDSKRYGSSSGLSGSTPSSRSLFSFGGTWGVYLAGFNRNTFSGGYMLQLGPIIDFGPISIELLAEGMLGLGYPVLFEWRGGGMGQIVLDTINLGLGFGGGVSGGNSLGFTTDPPLPIEEDDKGVVAYLKATLCWKYNGESALVPYGVYYLNNTWGLGIQCSFGF
jgi:hypothetical protein